MHGSIRHRRFISRRSILPGAFDFCAALAAAVLVSPLLAAQTTMPPASIPSANQHQKPSAATPQQAAAAAPAPNWPINAQPHAATVTWEKSQLRIDAANSSLQQILNDIASATGSSVDGASKDERIFGSFGPAPARDVLAQLLQGTGYNVLMIGGQNQEAPRQIILSTRNAGKGSPGVTRATPEDNEEDFAPEPQVDTPPQPVQQQPPPPQQLPQPLRPGFNPGVNGQPPQQQVPLPQPPNQQ